MLDLQVPRFSSCSSTVLVTMILPRIMRMVATPCNTPLSLISLLLGRAGRFLQANDINKTVYQFGALTNKPLFSRGDTP